MFRAYDVRGKYGSVVTKDNFFKLGKALNEFSSELVLGMDCREHNSLLAGALASGFDGEETFLGVSPTPATCFLSEKLGVCVTASHNPVGDAGAKMFLEKKPFFEEQMFSLNAKYSAEKARSFKGVELVQKDLLDEYVYALPSCEAGVFDLAGGAVTSLKRVFPRTIFSEPDARFEKHSPEPTKAALSELIALSKRENCLGFAFDGDGDRLSVVDSGEFVLPSVLVAFIAKNFLKKNDGIVLTIDFPEELFSLLRDSGFKVFESRVGDVFVLEKALKEKAVFSAEVGGHYSFLDFMPHSDGVYAASLLSRVKPGSIASCVEFKRFTLYDAFPGLFDLTAFKESALALNPVETSFIDGVKAVFEDYSFLVRHSNTQEKTRVMIEAETREKALSVLKLITSFFV
ncbi:MAG: hypothetical protein ABH803_03160 [Candidatus Micrarchaeota archaeon]